MYSMTFTTSYDDIYMALQGGLLQKLHNSTIFATAILGLLSGAGAIYYLDRMQGVAQSRWYPDSPYSKKHHVHAAVYP